MEIRPYSYYKESEILPLYQSVGWQNYYQRPEMLRKAYESSLCILGAFEAEALVGIIRAVGDGVSILLIQDILVHPLHQRQGIGTKLIQAMLGLYTHVYQMQLMTDDTEKTKAFYSSIGFKPMDAFGCCGFAKFK